jgi:hypothetical protein
MPRQRASQASAAFARVGTVQVPAGDDATATDIIPGSVNAGQDDSGAESMPASPAASAHATTAASVPAGEPAVSTVSGKAGLSATRIVRGKAGAKASVPASRRALGKPPRKLGRPRGPARVQMGVRILATTDDRLDVACVMTQQTPQEIVDAALSAYLDALGVPRWAPDLRERHGL